MKTLLVLFLSISFSPAFAAKPVKITKTTTDTTTSVKTSGDTTTTSSKQSVTTKSITGNPVKNGSVEFFALGKPSMLKIHGTSEKLTGVLKKTGSKVQGELEIPTDSFETGMGVRNTHLKEKIFESEKFPKASLTIDELTLPEGKMGKLEGLPFTGTFHFHGTDKKVSGTVDIDLSDSSLKFAAKFLAHLTDHGITPPEFMGMTVQDEVRVEAKGETVQP